MHGGKYGPNKYRFITQLPRATKLAPCLCHILVFISFSPLWRKASVLGYAPHQTMIDKLSFVSQEKNKKKKMRKKKK